MISREQFARYAHADVNWGQSDGPYGHYLQYWGRFQQNAWFASWNWSAFLFGPLWFAYRRMYVYALIYILLLWVPGLNFAVWIGSSIFANALYLRHATMALMRNPHAVGGTSKTAVVVFFFLRRFLRR